jgi:gluconate 2-dehydrogenase gamma chain
VCQGIFSAISLQIRSNANLGFNHDDHQDRRVSVTQFLDMDRRQWLARAFWLVGASAASGSALTGAIAAKPKVAAKPAAKSALNRSQMVLLSAVSDTIMPATDTPGALGAGVPAKLNGMLTSWASPANRTAIIDALGRIDMAAMTARKIGFSVLTPADRKAVLRPHDAAALKPVAAPPGAAKPHPFSAVPWVADQGYLKLKDLIIALYYSSEVAMTQEVIYEHVPGTWQPSTKANATTRPWASVGPF